MLVIFKSGTITHMHRKSVDGINIQNHAKCHVDGTFHNSDISDLKIYPVGDVLETCSC